MQAAHFDQILDRILVENHRYHRDAYLFVREALDFTQKEICKKNKNEVRHVTGQELLDGIRRYALEQYGPMTTTLFDEWRIRRCADFGELVFIMVEYGLLNKTDQDKREDFEDGYEFDTAFRKPFLPTTKPAGSQGGPTSTEADPGHALPG